ncbi:galactose 1-dehydrogenase [Hephaestia caeni]|uniref:Galactose 1-dehydrogenase n=1 Tax=Hephaestia caeni TaxID=645617 RepID=A0A397NIW0_9SPHN|nr:Gfo/Idh/MocA family oxidoreductase [Hephaestia caeni]RIA37440.1 galactose 1-dehydrogenase [Hephaestia caeni]
MSSTPVPIAIVGIGKIARDQHIPTIAADPNFRLAAVVTRNHPVEGVPAFATITDMATAMPEVKAISICTPPRGRLDLVREAIAAGLDIMLEKPPAATIGEAEAIAEAAAASDVVLHATWHSREAAAVEPALAWLADRTIRNVAIAWKEDVRVWHPGQEWIWESGIGVFDPGINALSVLTRLIGDTVLLETAALRFPSNRTAPIAADLTLSAGAIPIEVAFDFDQRGPQTWDIVIETDGGTLTLSAGASKMAVDGTPVPVADDPEYARLYRRFHHLVTTRTSDVDFSPFRLVADAFMLGRRETVDAFDWAS